MFSVYGPNQNLANKMQGMASIYLSFMLEGKPITVKGAKDRFRDLVYVDDVVQAWLLAWNQQISHGRTYNLGTGTKTTVETLLRTLAETFGDPAYPIEYGANTPGDQHGMVADPARLRTDLGWAPATALAAGISAMVKFHTEGH
jgi:UDP-glucose 4-epimerase